MRSRAIAMRSIARVTALFLNRTAGSSTNLFALGELQKRRPSNCRVRSEGALPPRASRDTANFDLVVLRRPISSGLSLFDLYGPPPAGTRPPSVGAPQPTSNDRGKSAHRPVVEALQAPPLMETGSVLRWRVPCRPRWAGDVQRPRADSVERRFMGMWPLRRQRSADCSPRCGLDTIRNARSEKWPHSWRSRNRL
jgi:hypothetical protein